jgi:protein-S-isoprenylcysteine O-methyltransferase Ste14
MHETFTQKIRRIFFAGPVLLVVFVALETAAFATKFAFAARTGGAGVIPLGLAGSARIAVAAIPATVLVVGYVAFLRSYLKNDVGVSVMKTGPYAVVRHPLYATEIWTLPAFIVLWQNDALFALPWALLVAIAHLIVKMEERYMEEKFGDEYRVYRKSVPALFPNPFRKGQGRS